MSDGGWDRDPLVTLRALLALRYEQGNWQTWRHKRRS